MEQQRRSGFPALTGLRGVAAFWVFAFHLTKDNADRLLDSYRVHSLPVLRDGWAGVDLFFILSGFVLMFAHGESFRRPNAAEMWRFAKLRIGRVGPLNLVVLLLIVAVASIDVAYRTRLYRWSVGDDPVVAFMRTALLGTVWLPGRGSWNEPTWSLSVEIVGYVAFPVLALASGRLRSFGAALTAALAAFGLLAAYQVAADEVGKNDLMATPILVRMACCFVGGMALSQARAHIPPALERYASPISSAVVLLALGTAAFRPVALLMPLSFGALVFMASFNRCLLARALTSPLVLFSGAISFPLYLVHVQVIVWFEEHVMDLSTGRPTGAAILLGIVCVAVGLAWILHRWVEVPSHRFARRAARRQSVAADVLTPTPG